MFIFRFWGNRPCLSSGSGVIDLVYLPVQQYKEDGRIMKGLQRGTNSFTYTTAVSLLQLTSKLFSSIQSVAEVLCLPLSLSSFSLFLSLSIFLVLYRHLSLSLSRCIYFHPFSLSISHSIFYHSPSLYPSLTPPHYRPYLQVTCDLVSPSQPRKASPSHHQPTDLREGFVNAYEVMSTVCSF